MTRDNPSSQPRRTELSLGEFKTEYFNEGDNGTSTSRGEPSWGRKTGPTWRSSRPVGQFKQAIVTN